MESLKLILDFGSSELRSGLSGDLEPQNARPNKSLPSESDFMNFVKSETGKPGSSTAVILIEKNIRNQKLREKNCQFLFESLEFEKVFFAKNAVSRLYASGKSSGTVIENSETSFEIATVEDGFLEQFRIVKSSFNFQGVTGDQLSNAREILINSANLNELTLPDDLKIYPSEYQCSCVNLVDEFLNKNAVYSKDLVLGGRMFLHNGFLEPILQVTNNRFNVSRNVDKKDFLVNGAFIGASILGVVSEIDVLFVSKKEWEEFGSVIIHKQFS